ncbi:phosphoribosylformylglycinamidine synthase subunit PurL [Persicimonas caeni]|uniref:Phosphoribosylformylglycinamidine synthase subunit PurL n=1 Tax=Persicimonas caeni TaxID=2292766 RepID=A0A4Y6PLL1_PERCE|nr:phosphoribosylformylglycinamidine synthase subunit PurL [Persicimonas caeni]QDG49214.1 phosphoribosylformylglycinamidine synthase subunit PurL [Persicimonas caeni]QED30435.1 phosphoribosylformylglycinamidine synthase subunit PurL [Persicimonas caeni]
MKLEEKREFAKANGLSDEEFDLALEILGREPTLAEVGVVSAMWSEHCSYKSSRVHLSRLPTEGPQVVQGPGENAGAVDIGGGYAAVFKMESHNHPSYIEPYQGAATGVGGILRDVFTMGARPIGNMNSLRFGAVDHEKTPHLFHGVVAGIAGYGNCIGVPTVGGEIYFDPSYNGNILVNVFNVGVCRKDEIFKGIAEGVGNPIFYVGSGTGRDGIHGATMASQEFSEEKEAERPTVQVGDPFREKLLLEACQELMRTDSIVGIQDMGAAGLTSSSVEMADRAGNGVRIDADKIPAREENMSAYEFLLSESQERMLIVVEKGKEDAVAEIFDRWELEWAQIGEVTEGDSFEVWQHGEKVVDIPVSKLTSAAPKYDRPQKRPAYMDELEPASVDAPADLAEAFEDLVGSPNICSRNYVYEQFDHMVGVGTVVRPGAGDAAVLRVPGTDQSLAIAVDCNSRFCYLDAEEGAKLAVAECARNLSCVGAKPLGTTDCMNFGNPENPEIMWQFARAVDGMKEACIALDAPVVSGNVSLYNASNEVDIYPTPSVALVGGFDGPLEGTKYEAGGYTTMDFKESGDRIILLGETDQDDLGGSEYLWRQTGQIGDKPPKLDLDREVVVQKLVRELIANGQVRSAHDCAEGGLGVALAEGCFTSSVDGIGVKLDMDATERPDLELFSESPSRIVVSVAADKADAVLEAAEAAGVPAADIGETTDDGQFVWGEVLDVAVDTLADRWRTGLDSLHG